MASSAGILGALAGELEHASELCDVLESLVSRLVRESETETPEMAMRDAQAVDALAQHIAGLATFARTLARQRPQEDAYDVTSAVRKITLSELAARLSARSYNEESPASAARAEEGELQLF